MLMWAILSQCDEYLTWMYLLEWARLASLQEKLEQEMLK